MDFSSLGIADNKLLLWAVAAVAVLIVIYILYRIVVKIKRAMRRLSNRIGRFSNIVEEVYTASKNADKIESETPKSVSGMTSLLLPRISKDFPDFNWHEVREHLENKLREKLTAEGSTDIVVHKSVISRYNKDANNISITCQTALKYKNPNKQYIGEYKQSRFTTEVVYMQKLDDYYEKDSLGVYTCPNCGASVDNYNGGVCAYCGSKLRDLNVRIWSVADIEEK
jgi:hypothetical protein